MLTQITGEQSSVLQEEAADKDEKTNDKGGDGNQNQDTVNNINRAQLEIGSMEVKKHELMHSIAGHRDELTLLQNERDKEYGTFDINIQDGIITYEKENGQADS